MQSAAICFVADDLSCAEELAHYLGLHASCDAELADCSAPDDFLDLIEQCLHYSFVVAVLSRKAVPQSWPRAQWERVLVQSAQEANCRIVFYLHETCPFPALLRPRAFDSLSLLRRWAIQTRHPERTAPAIAGDSQEDESLLTLVERPSSLQVERSRAVWLARTHWRDFENVYWINCAHRGRTGTLGEMASALCLTLDGPVEQNWAALRAHAEVERALYIFEKLDLENLDLVELAQLGGRASVIVLRPGEKPQPIGLSEMKRLFLMPGADEAACLRWLDIFISCESDAAEWPDVKAIASRAQSYLTRSGRLAEAAELLIWLKAKAAEYRDIGACRQIEWDLQWIFDKWGLPVIPTDASLSEPLQLKLPLSDTFHESERFG